MNIRTLLILALPVLACACSTVNTVERAEPSASPKMVADKRVITDGALNDYAYVAGVSQSIASGNLMRVQVKIVNSTAAFRNVNYKFTWFDENGMQVAASPGWGVFGIEGGQAKYLDAVAPTPKAKDFSLQLLADVR